jgi:hypothetical protein
MNPLNHADKFFFLYRQIFPDGMGTWKTEWTQGAEFDCLLQLNNSIEARVAEKNGVTSVFTGIVEKALPIEYNDVFKRVSDDATFRITSNPADKKTPDIATFAVKSFSAERHTLPEG